MSEKAEIKSFAAICLEKGLTEPVGRAVKYLEAAEEYKNQFSSPQEAGDEEINDMDNPCKNPKPECHCFWSPIKNEREFQEQLMKRISSHYPNAYTPWQYFNGLLFMALAYAGKEKEYDEELKILDNPMRSKLTNK